MTATRDRPTRKHSSVAAFPCARVCPRATTPAVLSCSPRRLLSAERSSAPRLICAGREYCYCVEAGACVSPGRCSSWPSQASTETLPLARIRSREMQRSPRSRGRRQRTRRTPAGGRGKRLRESGSFDACLSGSAAEPLRRFAVESQSRAVVRWRKIRAAEHHGSASSCLGSAAGGARRTMARGARRWRHPRRMEGRPRRPEVKGHIGQRPVVWLPQIPA
jgi:hypothetical protein